jgi:hypothetical protein
MRKRIITVLLACILALSVFACAGTPDDPDNPVNPDNPTVPGDNGFNPDFSGGDTDIGGMDFHVDGTIHEHNITETASWLVQGGQSDYVLVLDTATADEHISAAKKDFVSFFADATDTNLRIVDAGSAVWSQDARYIVVGDNAVSRAAGVTADYDELGPAGFVIKTVGKSIVMVGGANEGSLWAAYEFLTIAFHFEYFGIDTYSIDRGIHDYKLMNYVVKERPDVGIRSTNYQFLMSDNSLKLRLRLTRFGDLVIPVAGATVHNSLQWIPKSTHQNAHPKWFSVDGKNLCYQARGDAAELDLMQAEALAVMKAGLIQYPDRRIITFTHEDTQTLCTCPACTESKAHYNDSEAGPLIIFMNRLMRETREWFATEQGAPYSRDLQLLFFAYHATNKPPVNYDAATGIYTPVDDKVVMDPSVSAYFAETNADYTRSWYDQLSVNKQYADNLKGWAALSKQLWLWMYQTNFSYYLTPYNSFNNTQETYKYAIENKVDFIYDQGQSNQTGSATGWSHLKIYLYSKLTWNVNQDMNELTERFFRGCYGDAADIMLAQYYSWRTWATYQTDVLDYTGSRSIFLDPMRADYWPKQLLMQWHDQIAAAIEAIAPLKVADPVVYKTLLKNITVERVQWNYLLVSLYSSSMTFSDLAALKQEFYDDVQLSPILRESERGGTITQLLQGWGVI